VSRTTFERQSGFIKKPRRNSRKTQAEFKKELRESQNNEIKFLRRTMTNTKIANIVTKIQSQKPVLSSGEDALKT
jgi:hypothetical protein